MSTLTIENIPEQLYRRLKREAAHHRRSLTQQVLWFLEQGLMKSLGEPVGIDERTQWLEPIKPAFPISSESINAVLRVELIIMKSKILTHASDACRRKFIWLSLASFASFAFISFCGP